MRKRTIYPGAFDPVTYGHLDIIKRAVKSFDEVVVAIAHVSDKECLFSVSERKAMVKRATKNIKNVKVDDFNGLVVDYALKNNIRVIIRGLRMISDFEYEFQMALTNRKLSDKIETIFMMPNEAYAYLSSRLIKQAASLGADVSPFIPKFVARALRKKLKI